MQIAMGFTEDQKAMIREIAWEVGKAICVEIRADRLRDIELHEVKCPVADQMKVYKARAAGFIAAFTLIGGVVGGIIVIAGKAIVASMTAKP